MSGPRIGSLFSGYGGLDLAVTEVLGGEVVWHVENDPAPSKILARRWPNTPNHGDVTAIDWARVEPVDVLCGGFPCTDVSSAGLRTGMVPGTRSGLWAHMARAVEVLRPQAVVIENVAGLLTADGEPWPQAVTAAHQEAEKWGRVANLIQRKERRAKRRGGWHGEYAARKRAEAARAAKSRDRAMDRFKRLRRRLVQRAIGTVVGTLSQLGYDSCWRTLRASDIGAAHHRERVFILAVLADSHDAGREEQRGSLAASAQHPAPEHGGRATEVMLPTPTATQYGRNKSPSPGAAMRPSLDGIVRGLLPTPKASDGITGRPRTSGRPIDKSTHLGTIVTLLPTPRAAEANQSMTAPGARRHVEAGNGGLTETLGAALLPTPTASERGDCPSERDRRSPDIRAVSAHFPEAQSWGKYEPAIRRWEEATRPAPEPTEPNKNGNPRLSVRFVQWLMGLPEGWVTDVPGLSRAEQLKALGNGVCPQQAVAALRSLLELQPAPNSEESA